MFIRKKSVGIDISDHSIEIAEVVNWGNVKVRSLGRTELEPGIVQHGSIKDEARLLEALKHTLISAKPSPIITRRAVFGLPEAETYIHLAKVREDFFSKNELEREDLVRNEAQRSVPIPPSELAIAYKVLDKSQILVIATSVVVLREWQRFFRKVRIEISAFDLEIFAVFRNLQIGHGSACIVDIGGKRTTIALFDNTKLQYSYSLDAGGFQFTKEIARSLKINDKEAEKEKVKSGLSKAKEKLFFPLVKSLSPILKEIEAALNMADPKPELIYLVGGGSKLHGILEYFVANLNVPVELGRSKTPLESEDPLLYLEAVGLALRAFGDDNPAFGEEIRKKENLTPLLIKMLAAAVFLAMAGTLGWLLFLKGSNSNQITRETIETKVESFIYEESFLVPISLSLDKKTAKSNEISGRVIGNSITDAETKEEAIIRSIVMAEKELVAGEKLWPRPFSEAGGHISWLAYSEDGAKVEMQKEAVKIFGGKRLEFKKVEEISLEKMTAENSIVLSFRVTISSKEPISRENTKKVKIGDTETGWLNVRNGPGTSFDIIGRVTPGGLFTLLEEKGDWAGISIGGGKQGWVARKYLINVD